MLTSKQHEDAGMVCCCYVHAIAALCGFCLVVVVAEAFFVLTWKQMMDAGRRLCTYVHATTTYTELAFYRPDAVGACAVSCGYVSNGRLGGLGACWGGAIVVACFQRKGWRCFVHNSITPHWTVYFLVV